MAGRLRTGTSGFAYPAWSPRFYPSGARGPDLLRHYGAIKDKQVGQACFLKQDVAQNALARFNRHAGFAAGWKPIL